MAVVVGYDGNVTFTNLTVGTKTWVLNIDADVIDTTDFSSTGWRDATAGLKKWTATVDAKWDTTNTAALGDTGALLLTVTTSEIYYGTAFINSMPVTHNVEGVALVTYSFTGKGALSTTSV